METKEKYVTGTEKDYKTVNDIYEQFLTETKIDPNLVETYIYDEVLPKGSILITLKSGSKLIYSN